MPQEPNRGDATMDKVSGNVKSFVGGVIGNDDMKRDGEKEKAQGEGQYKLSQSKDAAEATGDKIKGTFQKNVTGLVSDEQRAKGETNLASGDAKEEKSKH